MSTGCTFMQADQEGDPTHIGRIQTNSSTLDSIAAINQATSKANKNHQSTLTGIKRLHNHRYVMPSLHDLQYLPAQTDKSQGEIFPSTFPMLITYDSCVVVVLPHLDSSNVLYWVFTKEHNAF